MSLNGCQSRVNLSRAMALSIASSVRLVSCKSNPGIVRLRGLLASTDCVYKGGGLFELAAHLGSYRPESIGGLLVGGRLLWVSNPPCPKALADSGFLSPPALSFVCSCGYVCHTFMFLSNHG